MLFSTAQRSMPTHRLCVLRDVEWMKRLSGWKSRPDETAKKSEAIKDILGLQLFCWLEK